MPPLTGCWDGAMSFPLQTLQLTKPSDMTIFTLILHFIACGCHDLLEIEAFNSGRIKTFGAIALF
jgi:hypothetical protein